MAGKSSLKDNLLLVLFVAIIAVTHLLTSSHHGLAQVREYFEAKQDARLLAPAHDCAVVQDWRTVTVEIDRGFRPQKVVARVCDRLRFINQSNISSDPAVGPHPTHAAYPEFDAKRPLKKSETFEFTLSRTGTYSFHDHLNPNIEGLLTVNDR